MTYAQFLTALAYVAAIAVIYIVLSEWRDV